MVKQSLHHLELAAKGVWAYITAHLSARKSRISPLAKESTGFVEEVREQFLQLKEKGLGITVFTV